MTGKRQKERKRCAFALKTFREEEGGTGEKKQQESNTEETHLPSNFSLISLSYLLLRGFTYSVASKSVCASFLFTSCHLIL